MTYYKSGINYTIDVKLKIIPWQRCASYPPIFFSHQCFFFRRVCAWQKSTFRYILTLLFFIYQQNIRRCRHIWILTHSQKRGLEKGGRNYRAPSFFPMYAHENMCANLTRAYSYTGMGVVSNEKGSNEKKKWWCYFSLAVTNWRCSVYFQSIQQKQNS